MAATLITYSHNVKPIEGCSFEIVRLISGTLELSALYSFKFLIKVRPGDEGLTSCVKAMQQLLGSRIRVDLRAGNSRLQTVLGIVMSIESSTQYGKGEDAGWYVWNIRPELAQACYSCGRRIFADSQQITKNGDGKDSESSVSLVDVLTAYYRARWNTDITFDTAARKRIPDTIQLRQNDESDYNFLTRLLTAWGLGYSWDFSGARESITVYDAVDASLPRSAGDLKSSTAIIPTMHPVSSGSSMWKLSYGVQNLLRRSKPLVENYNAVVKQNEGCVSLHDESWDQRLGTSFERDTVGIFRSRNDNGRSCHGAVTVQEEADATNASRLCLRGKVQWATDTPQYSSSDIYYITRMQFSAANKSWEVIINGRTPDEQSGLGILPKPVHLNNSPDLSEDELICGDSWPEPQPRYFLAVVEDGSIFSNENKNIVSTLPSRNLCKVREIAPQNIKKSDSVQITLENTLWVELGSPFADKDSGLLTRPRKGNVLLCLDRGDLSIPLAVSSLFRDNNAAPFAELHTLDRTTRKDAKSNVTDYSAVTLRNRTHVPSRNFLLDEDSRKNTEIDLDVRDGSPTGDGSSGTDRFDLDATRPMSVEDLASKRLPFNQIQIISQDNGVQPVEQDPKLSNTYFIGAIGETIAGITVDLDLSNYVTVNAAKDAQKTLYSPIARPHFEGINIYSNSDFLLQSADHQLINAGGEIVVTAAQAITLRVGKSYIRIGEDGIEISSPLGRVSHAGAYAAYNTKDKSQVAKCSPNQGMPLGGSLVVGSNGISMKGPYITNTATNMFKATTFFGSSLSLSDYSCKITAPSVDAIGGASAYRTMSALVSKGVFKSISDICKSETSSSSAYTGSLMDGRKLSAPRMSNAAATINSSLAYISSLITGLMKSGDNMKKLFSLKGSLLRLLPEGIKAAGGSIEMKSTQAKNLTTVAAEFAALGLSLRSIVQETKAGKALSFTSSLFNEANTFSDFIASLFSKIGNGTSDSGAFSLLMGTTCSQEDLEVAIEAAKEKLEQAEKKPDNDEKFKDLATYNSRMSEAEKGSEAGIIAETFGSSLLLGAALAAIDVALRIAINKREQNLRGTNDRQLCSDSSSLQSEDRAGISQFQTLSEQHEVGAREQSVMSDEEEALSEREVQVDGVQEAVRRDATAASTTTTTVTSSDESGIQTANFGTQTECGFEIQN